MNNIYINCLENSTVKVTGNEILTQGSSGTTTLVITYPSFTKNYTKLIDSILPDGTKTQTIIDLTGGNETIEYVLVHELLDKYGRFQIEFLAKESEYNSYVSNRVNFNITKSIGGTTILEAQYQDTIQVLTNAVNAESQTRQQADSDLQSQIDSEINNRQNAITDESTAREQADNTLQNNINAEAQLREQADGDLIDYIDNHKNDTSNPHAVTKSQVGLGNVDNTSDINKPISVSVQSALDTKLNKTATAADSQKLGGQLPNYYAYDNFTVNCKNKITQMIEVELKDANTFNLSAFDTLNSYDKCGIYRVAYDYGGYYQFFWLYVNDNIGEDTNSEGVTQIFRNKTRKYTNGAWTDWSFINVGLDKKLGQIDGIATLGELGELVQPAFYFYDQDGTSHQIFSSFVKQAEKGVANGVATLDTDNYLSQNIGNNITKYTESLTDLGDINNATATLNLNLSRNFKMAVTGSTATIAFSNVPSGVVVTSVTLFVSMGSDYTVAYPASVKWNYGVIPTLSTTKVNELIFRSYDNGTSWFADKVGEY